MPAWVRGLCEGRCAMSGLSERPTLSIVVPTVNDTAALEETLVSILENRPADCEIIVPLACRYDDPWNIGDEVRFVAVPPHSSFTGCVNLGIASSRGRIIHVLAAGWRATAGWAEAALDRFAESDRQGESLLAVAPLAVASDNPSRPIQAGVRLTSGGRRVAVTAGRNRIRLDDPTCDISGLTPDGPQLEAGFWRADVFAAVAGGFATACGDGWCDVDMAVAVESMGGRVAVVADSRVIEGPRAWSGTPFAHGLYAERTFWRSLGQRPLFTSLLRHGWEVVRSCVSHAPLGTVPMLLGRALALLQFGGYVSRAHHLRRLQREAASGGDGETAIVRIDTAHAAVRPPRQRRSGTPPLRKSA